MGRELQSNIPPFGLRMQPDLKARVESAAKSNNRSLNSEIVGRLEDYEQRLADIRWLKTEMERLKGERDTAERALRSTAARALAETLARGLPKGLFGRVLEASERNNRTVEEEVVQALEKAFPVPATTDDVIRILSDMFASIDGRRPDGGRDLIDDDAATAGLRLYLAYLVQERDAGRGDAARKAPITLDLERKPDGSIGPIDATER